MKTFGRFEIGTAVTALKDCLQVRRQCWPDGVFITRAVAIDFGDVAHLVPYENEEMKEAHVMPSIWMWTADNRWQPSWVCSQADLLADDWEIAAEPRGPSYAEKARARIGQKV